MNQILGFLCILPLQMYSKIITEKKKKNFCNLLLGVAPPAQILFAKLKDGGAQKFRRCILQQLKKWSLLRKETLHKPPKCFTWEQQIYLSEAV